MNEREKRISIFEETYEFCMKYLSDEIVHTVCNTGFYDENDYPEIPGTVYDQTQVSVSDRRSFEAAVLLKRSHPDKKMGVLNFASPYNPGGAVRFGSRAQEESLCRCSSLYPCLDTKKLRESYYERNSVLRKFPGSDAVIYTPDIVVFKSDEEFPELLERKDWCTVDVITCAAPDLHECRSYEDERKLPAVYRRRIGHILHITACRGVDILVLGAWGCGAFRGDSLLIAKSFARELNRYGKYFMIVEFAIYDKGESAFSDNRINFMEIFEK